MKKILFLGLISFMLQINVYAQDKINLDFESVSKAKFIYCNNPEIITKKDLADSTYNDKPTLLMKQDINVGEYDLFISLRNLIDKPDLSKKNQEKVYVDVEFCNDSTDDLVIKVDKLGYQVPQSAMQLKKVSRYRNDTSWSCINAYYDYLQKKFNPSDYIQDGKYDFITHVPKPLPKIFNDEIIIKPGERFWLLSDSQSSGNAMLAGQVFLLLNNFKVVKGQGCIKIAAFVDINKYNENATDCGKFISEVRDGVKCYRYYKGIADLSTILQTDLVYDVDNETDSNIYLPVEIKNSFTNEYQITSNWITNLNPYANKNLAAKISQSDLFRFLYTDKNQTWFFDTQHTDFPNQFIICDEQVSYCNLGNWGVTNRYNITINNNSDYDQRLEYYLKSGSDFIINYEDKVKIRSHIDTKENINDELERYFNNDIEEYKKNLARKKLPFVLESQENISPDKIIDFIIPSRQSKTISFDVTLCTNCDGLSQNSLKLIRQDTPNQKGCQIKNIQLDNNSHRYRFTQGLNVEVNGDFPTNSVIKSIVYKKNNDKEEELIFASSNKCDDVYSFAKTSFSVSNLNKLEKGVYGIKIQIIDSANNVLSERNFDNVYDVSDKQVVSCAQIKNLNSLSIATNSTIRKLDMHYKINGLEENDRVVSIKSSLINCDKREEIISSFENEIDSNDMEYDWNLYLARELQIGNYEIESRFLIENNDLGKTEEIVANSLRFSICNPISVPLLNLNEQTYNKPQNLRLESDNNYDIYYKINNGDWILYKEPVKISYGKTNLKTFCTDGDFYSGARSEQIEKNYSINE